MILIKNCLSYYFVKWNQFEILKTVVMEITEVCLLYQFLREQFSAGCKEASATECQFLKAFKSHVETQKLS